MQHRASIHSRAVVCFFLNLLTVNNSVPVLNNDNTLSGDRALPPLHSQTLIVVAFTSQGGTGMLPGSSPHYYHSFPSTALFSAFFHQWYKSFSCGCILTRLGVQNAIPSWPFYHGNYSFALYTDWRRLHVECLPSRCYPSRNHVCSAAGRNNSLRLVHLDPHHLCLLFYLVL